VQPNGAAESRLEREVTGMEVAQNLVKTTLEEIEKVLSTKTVVGEPITVEGVTLIPLISVGFGFGAGGGSGRGPSKKSEEIGEGTIRLRVILV